MSAAIYDLNIEQGAAFWQSFTYKDASGTPKNITGYSVRAQIRATAASPNYLLELTVANSRIANFSPSTGYFEISLTATDTSSLPAGQWVYDLEIYQTAGIDVKRLLQGNVNVSAEVTR